MQTNNEAFRKFDGELSPIVENSSCKSLANKKVVERQNLLGEDSTSNTSASTSLLKCNIRQQNDIESSHDQENIQTTGTKDDSEEMSGTFDVGKTETSTLVNTQSKEEKEMSTTACEEYKTETADPSVENYDSGDEDDNENDDHYNKSVEGEDEKGINDGSKDSHEDEDHNENYNKDNSSVDQKGMIDGRKDSAEEDIPHLNTATNQHLDNSDDIIPSNNTQPEAESPNLAMSNSEMAQTEPTKTCASSEVIESSAMKSIDIKHVVGGGPIFR